MGSEMTLFCSVLVSLSLCERAPRERERGGHTMKVFIHACTVAVGVMMMMMAHTAPRQSSVQRETRCAPLGLQRESHEAGVQRRRGQRPPSTSLFVRCAAAFYNLHPTWETQMIACLPFFLAIRGSMSSRLPLMVRTSQGNNRCCLISVKK